MSESSARAVQDFAEAAACLAEEASLLARVLKGDVHSARVAAKAAQQARDAAVQLRQLALEDAPLESAMSLAAWSLSAAAVAVTEARREAHLQA